MSKTQNPSHQVQPTIDTAALLRGRKWKAVINGRMFVNGARYSATITGDVESIDDESTIYDVIRLLADHLEYQNREMKFPDSFRITLYPNKDAQ